jgi:hypothetical protein
MRPQAPNAKGDKKMEIIIPQSDLQQDCLDKLSRVLDLVLKTAEAASAENNHKVVIQSAREVTRIAGLMHKMTNRKSNPAPALRGALAVPKTAGPCAPGKNTSSRPERTGKGQPAPGHNGKTDMKPDDLIMPDLETLFTPDEIACWDGLPDNIFKKFGENYRELQTIGQEIAADLLAADQEGEAAD